MEKEELKLGKLDIKMSTMLKGIAIILMVAHHSFGFPNDWISSIKYNSHILGMPINELIRWSTKICVAIFAFITGYAYFFSKTPTIKYGLKKIWGLLKRYWFILFVIFLPLSLYIGSKVITGKIILYNILALNKRLIPFAWYVYFYVFAMLTMPFIKKCFNGKWVNDFVIPSLIFATLANLLGMAKFSNEFKWIKSDLNNIFLYMPCIIYGFLFAKYNLFEKLDKYLKPKYIWQAVVIIILIFGISLNWHTVMGFNMYTLYVPIFIYSCMIILNNLKYSIIPKLLEFLGKNSLNIWFLHALFLSGYTRDWLQPIGFLPKNPILVVCWEIILCLPISMLINLIFKYEDKLEEKIKSKFIKNKGEDLNDEKI